MEAWVAQHDLQPRARRRVELHHVVDLVTQVFQDHGCHCAMIFRSPTCRFARGGRKRGLPSMVISHIRSPSSYVKFSDPITAASGMKVPLFYSVFSVLGQAAGWR